MIDTKFYEDIAEKRSIYYPFVEKALKIVLQFILTKKRILYGGIAIDLALKEKGHEGIYAPDSIPDYDFMSPDFYNDSNELADILYKEGLPEISAINALHLNTRRVRTNFIPVADITYIPPDLYEKIPTIKTKSELIIVHPDFQRLDMHRVFNFPFQNPPFEAILERFNKDQKRFKILADQYPIVSDIKNDNMREIEIDRKIIQNTCLGGIVVYGFLRNLLLRCGDYIDIRELDKLYPAITDFGDKVKVISSYPFNLSTDNFPRILSFFKGQKVKYYNKFLEDLKPRCITIPDKNIEIFDNKGKQLPCYNLQKIANFWQKLVGLPPINGYNNVYISHPQHILLYFLQRFYDLNDTNKELDKYLYWSTLRMIELGEDVFLEMIKKSKIKEKDYFYFPFFLSIKTYGEYNWSPTYIVSVREKLQRIRGLEPQTERPVFGYYPENNIPAPIFDPLKSELFAIDGKERDAFEPLNLKIENI
ncbi:MAG: hypothetical protein QW303_00005 [Nitrososphaerota archaeon]